jgi:Uma2 family endonuclease
MSAAPLLPDRREWTVDDLAELPPDFRYELINGRLIVPSPTVAHQDLMGDVWLALRANCPPEFVVSMDQSLRVDRRSEPRPDVVAVKVEHYGRTPVAVADVALAVEIISPDSTFRDMYAKAHLYAAAGVPTYWVIDPLHDKMTLTELVLAPRGEYDFGVHTADVFSTDRPWPVTLDLPALTERRAELLARAEHRP